MKIGLKTSIQQLIQNLKFIDNELVIFIEKTGNWTEISKVIEVIFENDEEYNSITEIDGYTYFLEVNLITEIIQVWSYTRNGKTPTLQQKCEAVIYYAMNDAYLPLTSN